MNAEATDGATFGASGPHGVAIVTGACRNIGAAVATELAAAGASVAVNHLDEASADEAGAVVDRIRDAGGVAIAVRADVSSERDVTEMVRKVQLEFGPISVLVNNAAASVASSRPWQEITAEEWTRVMAVNVVGGAICARAVAPSMIACGRGSIINMSSVTALLGATGNLHYVTSKAAQLGFTRSLARELGVHRIRVNAIVIGAIETPSEAVYGDPDELARYLSTVQALERRGTPDDIAQMVSFLASNRASFITGQAITVDGGWVMH
ncbi:MAG: SDR family oxidoreductase [Ilumatobacteraceae bacterium]|nr:SDR family oxidoreductase [Ilumatobacteraceae bacterium]